MTPYQLCTMLVRSMHELIMGNTYLVHRTTNLSCTFPLESALPSTHQIAAFREPSGLDRQNVASGFLDVYCLKKVMSSTFSQALPVESLVHRPISAWPLGTLMLVMSSIV